MNMIVNKSDLVGYEAVDTKAAKKEALAKLVAAWESKQARNARRFGGLGFLAVSLAACNSSDDDTTTTTTTTTTETTTPVSTAVNATLTDDDTAGVSVDVITGTTSADTIEATQATLDTTDVITDATSGDGDTMTVTATDNVSSPSIVNGIENIVYNMNTFTLKTIDVANVYGANITVNNTQLGGNATVTVNNLGNGSTLNLGTQTTGAITITGNNGSATVNAGTGAIQATNISTDGMTFNAVTGSSFVLDGAAATSVATVNAATGVTATVDAGNGGNAISNLTLSGGGSFTITGTAAGAYTASGASGATIIGAPAMFDGLALTDSTTGGTVTLQLNDLVGGAHNMDEMLADVIEITADDTSAADDTLTVASGTTVKISHALTNGLTIDADAARTGAPLDTAEVGNVSLGATIADAQGLTVSDFETITVTTTGTDAISVTALTAAAAATLTLNGTAPLTLTAVTADTVDASGYTGAITHTMASATADNFTFGSGDDSVTFATGETVTVVGGAGNDTLIGTTDMSNVTFSGFELFTAGGNITASDSSQFNGGSMIINGGRSITINQADTATIDLSGHTMADPTADTFIVTGALDTAVFVASQALNITGSSANDTLTGTVNADTINGGAGDDTITGAAGADSITTGAGGDTIVALEGAMAAGTAAAEASTTGFDTVSDFTVGETASSSDKITYATADTSIVQSLTATATATSAAISAKGIATFHADDDTLAEKIVATNAGINTGTEAAGATAAFMHGSDAYVFIHDGTTALSANDMLIKLTGIDLTASGSDTIDVATANTIIIT